MAIWTKSISKNCPIIIGGCHRSGTSLLRRILNAHSHIHCGPEVKFFKDFYDDFPKDITRNPRFMRTARSILPENELLDILGRSFIELHLAAAKQAGKPRWADKNPENALYLSQWQRLLGNNWRYIQIARNPMDTIASIKESPFSLVIPRELEDRIQFYLRITRAGLDFALSNPDRARLVLYEDLVTNTENEVSSLMKWLDEKFEPMQLSFNSVVQQPGMEDHKVVETTSTHTDSIGRWTHVLKPEEAIQIQQDCSPLWQQIDINNKYGYLLVIE